MIIQIDQAIQFHRSKFLSFEVFSLSVVSQVRLHFNVPFYSKFNRTKQKKSPFLNTWFNKIQGKTNIFSNRLWARSFVFSPIFNRHWKINWKLRFFVSPAPQKYSEFLSICFFFCFFFFPFLSLRTDQRVQNTRALPALPHFLVFSVAFVIHFVSTQIVVYILLIFCRFGLFLFSWQRVHYCYYFVLLLPAACCCCCCCWFFFCLYLFFVVVVVVAVTVTVCVFECRLCVIIN